MNTLISGLRLAAYLRLFHPQLAYHTAWPVLGSDMLLIESCCGAHKSAQAAIIYVANERVMYNPEAYVRQAMNIAPHLSCCREHLRLHKTLQSGPLPCRQAGVMLINTEASKLQHH